MGCGASTDKNDDANRRNSTIKAKGDDPLTRPTDGAEAKYAESASPVPSEVEALLEEMDRRTPSHASAAEQPSETVRSMRFAAAVTRGKVVNGMNADPDQFKDQLEVPEFKRRDRRRVDEWTKLVAAAVGADGPEALPEEGFYLTAPSFSVAFTSSGVLGPVASEGALTTTESSMQMQPRQRSSGGTNTCEFVDDSTDTGTGSVAFGGRRENSSIDHLDSGGALSRNPSGEVPHESARAALAKQQGLVSEQPSAAADAAPQEASRLPIATEEE